jgi:hypothetical protein
MKRFFFFLTFMSLLNSAHAMNSTALFARYFPDTNYSEAKKNPIILLDQIKELSPDAIVRITERNTVLTEVPFVLEPQLIAQAIYYGDGKSKLLRRVGRYILSQDHTHGGLWDAISVAVQFSNNNKRRAILDTAQLLLAQENFGALDRFLDENRPYHIPNGYRMVKDPLGFGKNGRVALVENEKTGDLFAWKIPTNDNTENIKSLKKELEIAQEWRKAGLTEMTTLPTPDGVSILKSFQDGKTLKTLIETEDLLGNRDSAVYKSLLQYVVNIGLKKIEISGVNSENIIYSNGRWNLIDGYEIHYLDSRKEAFARSAEEMKERWLDKSTSDSIDTKIEKFFTHADQEFKRQYKCEGILEN